MNHPILPNTAQPANDRTWKTYLWLKLGRATILSVYGYVFMEWLFLVTKPSFMDSLPFITKLGIPFLTGLVLIALSLAVLLPFFILNNLPWKGKIGRLLLWIGSALPSGFLAITMLLMVDNFTYTLFKFGIVTTTAVWRGVYGFGFLILFLFCIRWIFYSQFPQKIREEIEPSSKQLLILCGSILGISILFSIILYQNNSTARAMDVSGTAIKHPNILLIGSDGVNAERMSLYGYYRDTTPFLNDFSEDALFAQNNFTNSAVTGGSLVSMFTGKLPTQTRVLYPPDILKGVDSIQHLPAILKNQGYYNVEISVNYYADATVLNLQDGFVVVNNHSETVSFLYTWTRKYLPENAAYFISTIARRITDRIFHIYFIDTMPNPYVETTQPMGLVPDKKRVAQILTLFQTVKQPLFIHAHLMGTHDGILNPTQVVFSKGQDGNAKDMEAYYDDAVLSFDSYMEEIVHTLGEMGQLDNTVIIIYSDHGIKNTTNVRLPLMFRFPNGEFSGKITGNTQNLDIAPTILDYIGIKPPIWMSGSSLLAKEPPTLRPIFSAAPNFRKRNELNLGELDLSKIHPPFYQFGAISMIICQRWYTLDTSTLTWQTGEIQGHANPCKTNTLPDDSEAHQILLNQLKSNHFDISAFPKAP